MQMNWSDGCFGCSHGQHAFIRAIWRQQFKINHRYAVLSLSCATGCHALVLCTVTMWNSKNYEIMESWNAASVNEIFLPKKFNELVERDVEFCVRLFCMQTDRETGTTWEIDENKTFIASSWCFLPIYVVLLQERKARSWVLLHLWTRQPTHWWRGWASCSGTKWAKGLLVLSTVWRNKMTPRLEPTHTNTPNTHKSYLMLSAALFVQSLSQAKRN